jgi:secondary thiamine-phosphate synthase enzyme
MGRRQKMAVSLFVSEKKATTLRVAGDLVYLHSEEPQQFIDITELVRERVRRARVSDGWVNIQTRHTTTAVLVNEKDPLLLADLEDLLKRWAPKNHPYRHNDLEARGFQCPTEERPNGHAHARAFILGASETLNIMDGELQLGKWQSIFLVELDGIRNRGISIVVMGTPFEP